MLLCRIGLLYSPADMGQRMQAWISALDIDEAKPRWELVTLPCALIHPNEHIAIRPAPFRAQARWMAPRLQLDASPTARVYIRVQAMADSLRTQLVEKHNMPPGDYLDVHDFIRLTLSPKATNAIRQKK